MNRSKWKVIGLNYQFKTNNLVSVLIHEEDKSKKLIYLLDNISLVFPCNLNDKRFNKLSYLYCYIDSLVVIELSFLEIYLESWS